MLNINQNLKIKLKDIGLDLAEQQIVFFLLTNKVSSIADIAKGVNLPRSTIHLAVEHLFTRGVLASTVLGKRKLFFIDKPEKLKSFVEYEQKESERKLKELESILPQLRTLFALSGNSEKIDVEFLEGEEGFVETFFRSLNQDKNGEILRISGDTETFTKIRKSLKGYGKAHRKKGISYRQIITDSPLASDEIKEARLKLREVRVVPKNLLNPNLHFSMWKNHVTFTVWDEGLHSVIITNKSIADFMKMMFELVWAGAKSK